MFTHFKKFQVLNSLGSPWQPLKVENAHKWWMHAYKSYAQHVHCTFKSALPAGWCM